MPTLRPCVKCGEHIVVGDRFCAHCGAEQPVTLGGEGSEASPSRWDDLEKRLQAATEGRYHIRGLIGRGGMAAVFLADWPNMDLRIAIKVMDPYLLDQETFVQRFLQEARTIAKLRHRHIIRVYDSGNVDDLFYFCMDYYPGRSMEEVLAAESPLPIPVVKLWLSQAADALGYAHRQTRPVVHRDVKPSNMLLDKEGEVVLTDFGIAKVRDVGQTVRSLSLTMPGSVLGTPAYISPEQASMVLNPEGSPDAGKATSASDQYSLGVVGYEMLCGEPPFSGDLVPLCAAHAEQEPPDILTRRPDCPPELARIVTRMLEKRPEDRWPSMEAICGALAAPAPLPGSSLRTEMVEMSRGRKSVGSISLTPPSGEVFVGQSLKLSGTPLDLGGRPIPDRPLSWTSSDPDVALVTEEGVVRTLKPGPVSIVAEAEGVSGELLLAVSPIRVDTVVVLPSELSLPEGGEQTLRTLLLSRDGEELTDREISWTSNDPEVASVKGTGRVVAHGKGSTMVIASSEGRTGQARITVTPAAVASVEVSPPSLTLEVGGAKEVTCVPKDPEGRPLEDRPVEWSVDEPEVVEITADGGIRALKPGTATVSASVEGVRGTGVVTVSPERAVSLELSPRGGEVVERDTIQLRAVALSGRGEELAGRPILWTSSDVEVARVDREGRVTGEAPGSARITATCDEAVASVPVTVTPAPVTGLELATGALSVEAGETVQLSAIPRGPDGRPLARRDVTWSSSDPSVAEITPEGRLIAGATGEVRVMARCEGQSTETTISVRPEAVRSLSLEAPSTTVQVGDEVPVTCRVLGSSGRELEDRPVRWTSSAPDRAEVDQVGRVRARAPGEVVVTASCEGQEGALSLTVRPPAVASVEVRPREVELLPGESARLEVTVTDINGERVVDRPVTWTSSEDRILQVGEDGRLTGVASGKATVAVSCEGVSDQVAVEVKPAPVGSVELRPGRTRLKPRKGDEPAVVVRSHTGEKLTGRTLRWESSDPAVAEVDSSGRVRGLRPGAATISANCEDASDSYVLTVEPAGGVPAWATWGGGGLVVVLVVALGVWQLMGPSGADPGAGGGVGPGGGPGSADVPAAEAGPAGVIPGEEAGDLEEGASPEGASPEEGAGPGSAGQPGAEAAGAGAGAGEAGVEEEPAEQTGQPPETTDQPPETGTPPATQEPTEEEAAREPAPEPAVTSLRISPTGARITEGESLRLRLLDQNGTPVEGSFQGSDPSVASVTTSGELTARGAGTVNVTARYEGIQATATFQVEAAPIPEPPPQTLDSIRETVQEARARAGESDFPAAYELLDRSAVRLQTLQNQFPEATTLGDLYDWFIEEYRSTTRDCELYVEALTGLPGVELPTCKEPPGGGGI